MSRPQGVPALDVALLASAVAHGGLALALLDAASRAVLLAELPARAVGAAVALASWVLLLSSRWCATGSRRWMGRGVSVAQLSLGALWLVGPPSLAPLVGTLRGASLVLAGVSAAAAAFCYFTSPAREGTGLRALLKR